MNWLRKLFGLHVHQWGPTECIHTGPRHAHAEWCRACGNYRMVYGVACYPK